jgi:hypothetical protein
MNTGTIAIPYSLTKGYKNLDGAPTNSASETLTLAHATLHAAITDLGLTPISGSMARTSIT